MSTEKKNNHFKSFYAYFPEIELPITLSEEYSSVFSKFNKPLPPEFIEMFILDQHLFFGDQKENEMEIDEIVEYLPCFRIPENKNYFGIVYWKASLLKYEFILHTFDTKGKSIARQVIASTTSDGTNIRQVVATIDPDLEIYIMGGDSERGNIYNPENSKAFSLEITDMGQIIHHFEEN